MPRTNWKGAITFGLVSIPILLFNAIDPSSGISFKQINRKTGDKIKYKRVDSETEKEVPWEQIGRGYQYSKDIILPVEDDELKKVAGENARTIPIEKFVDKKSINYVNIAKTYYLIPEKKAIKGYLILREALKETNKIGIAKVIISTKEYLAAVATFNQALVLYLLHYENEIRKLDEFDIPDKELKKNKVSAKEIEIAKKLVNSMSSTFHPEKYKDEYKLAVTKWVEAKIKKHPLVQMESRSYAPKTPRTINFVELLRKSLETSKISTDKNKKRKPMLKKTRSHHRHVVV